MDDSQSALAIKTPVSDSGTIQLNSTWSFWIGDAVTEYVLRLWHFTPNVSQREVAVTWPFKLVVLA
jgi:hypothetical protein